MLTRKVCGVFVILMWVVVILVGVGCSSAEPQIVEVVREVAVVEIEAEAIEQSGAFDSSDDSADIAREPVADSDSAAANLDNTNPDPSRYDRNDKQGARLIIKNGEMTVEVSDTQPALDKATDIALNLGGYIINQNSTARESGYQYATLQIGVPSAQFEVAMRQLGELGIILNETKSGQDVTEEYIDLNARLTNLEATQERLRTFLSETTNVEDALKVDEELRKVEEEISVLKGRINFLADSAAFSKITLRINPILPTPTIAPTALPPTPEAWSPANTAKVASVQLQDNVQNTADSAIYAGIVCGPWLLFLSIFGWIGFRMYRRINPTGRPIIPQKPEPTGTD